MYYLSWAFTGTTDSYHNLYLGIGAGEKYYSYINYTTQFIVADFGTASGYILVPLLIIRTENYITANVFGDTVKSNKSDYTYNYPAVALSICSRTNNSLDPGASSNTIKMYYLQF